MRYSIRNKIALIFMAVVALMIGLFWIANNFFLEDFYIEQKKDRLLDAYNRLNQQKEDDYQDSSSFNMELQKLCETHNISVIVVDDTTMTIQIAGVANSQDMKFRLINNLMMSGFDNDLSDDLEANGQNRDDNFVPSPHFRQEDGEVYQETDQYIIRRVTDRVSETDYIEMWGFLDNGNVFMIRSMVAAIQDSVKLSNTFLSYTGIITLIIGIVIVLITSRQITKPILELNQISEKMRHLDFEAKYQNHHKKVDEIDQLGININILSESLERTISELKTANNELQTDNERKTQIDEMRKEFLSNVTHELKTPIALIQGYAEGLKEGITDDPESTEFYCDVIMDEANKMNRMVKQLLNLNHLEFGTDTVVMERFDIVAMIHNYLDNSKILIKQNELKVQFAEKMPINVWGDEFKVEEVFMNYFSNAINHVDDRRLIDIRIMEQNGKVRVSVFNSGQPIPEDSIPHIWEKFYKVDKARTREYGGSGVGLSIVKAIMDSMNQPFGVINYSDGVEFWFELENVS